MSEARTSLLLWSYYLPVYNDDEQNLYLPGCKHDFSLSFICKKKISAYTVTSVARNLIPFAAFELATVKPS